jgi:hypothetical protein
MMECPDCDGKGETYSKADKCSVCDDKKRVICPFCEGKKVVFIQKESSEDLSSESKGLNDAIKLTNEYLEATEITQQADLIKKWKKLYAGKRVSFTGKISGIHWDRSKGWGGYTESIKVSVSVQVQESDTTFEFDKTKAPEWLEKHIDDEVYIIGKFCEDISSAAAEYKSYKGLKALIVDATLVAK